MEADWDPQADGPGNRTGLFQYNQETWEAEYNNDGTPWSVATAQNVAISVAHALGGLIYRLDASERTHPERTLEQHSARALSLFNGEFNKYGQTGYGEAILNCARTIDTDFEAAYRYIWNARHPQ
jgi:hypothetical protein